MAGPLLGCCVCGSPVLCGVVGSVVTGPGPWTGCPPARPLALSFLSSSKELQLSGRHGLPALLGCCPSRTSAPAKVIVPGRPEPLNCFQMPCPRPGAGGVGRAPLGSVNTSTSVRWPPASPHGPPSETPGSSFPKHAQVYIPGPAPAAPSQTHETLRSQGRPARPAPGAWRCLTPPGMVPAVGSDDTGH